MFESKQVNISWMKLVGEAVLIFASVYLAIFLHGVATERAERDNAVDSLAQLYEELQLDQVDVAKVKEEQEELGRVYYAMVEWLKAPDMESAAGFNGAATRLLDSNQTLFSRRATWTTMVAGGELRSLRNAELVRRLGNLYENLNDRLDYSANFYDRTLLDGVQPALSSNWDYETREFLDDSPAAVTRLRNEVATGQGYNVFYRQLLANYSRELDKVLIEVERFLEQEGR
jgi:hypothetical protein